MKYNSKPDFKQNINKYVYCTREMSAV